MTLLFVYWSDYNSQY